MATKRNPFPVRFRFPEVEAAVPLVKKMQDLCAKFNPDSDLVDLEHTLSTLEYYLSKTKKAVESAVNKRIHDEHQGLK